MKAIKYAQAIAAACSGFIDGMCSSMSAHFTTMKRLDDLEKRNIKSLREATYALQRMGEAASKAGADRPKK